MTTMTLEQVRDWHRELASENASRRALCSPNGERWELWNDEFRKHVRMADAIDAYLAASDRKVDEGIAIDSIELPSGISKYDAPEGIAEVMNPDEAYSDGWNDCLQAIITKRGKVRHGLDAERLSVYEGVAMRVCAILQSHGVEHIDDPSEALEVFLAQRGQVREDAIAKATGENP